MLITDCFVNWWAKSTLRSLSSLVYKAHQFDFLLRCLHRVHIYIRWSITIHAYEHYSQHLVSAGGATLRVFRVWSMHQIQGQSDNTSYQYLSHLVPSRQSSHRHSTRTTDTLTEHTALCTRSFNNTIFLLVRFFFYHIILVIFCSAVLQIIAAYYCKHALIWLWLHFLEQLNNVDIYLSIAYVSVFVSVSLSFCLSIYSVIHTYLDPLLRCWPAAHPLITYFGVIRLTNPYASK